MSQLFSEFLGISEWELNLIFNIIVALGMIGVIAGLYISIQTGKNGISWGLLHVILSFFHQQLFSIVGTLFIVQGQTGRIETLGDWRLIIFIHIFVALIYGTIQIFSNAKNNSTISD